MMFFILLGCAFALIESPSSASAAIPRWDVFIQHSNDAQTADHLTFVDRADGREYPLDLLGERYTLAGAGVIYQDRASGDIMLVRPDEQPRLHPFIQPTPNARRLDWVVSSDQTRIAWTLTYGESNALMTETTVAKINGDEPNSVLRDGPRDGIRALPVAFSNDSVHLYLDYQPDGVGDFTPYPQYAGLFSVPLSGGDAHFLPGEPGCFCGAGFGAGFMLRLRLSADLKAFDLVQIELTGGVAQAINAPPVTQYTQAGNILIAPDGTKAVYTLAQIRHFGASDQSVRTVFVLVDLQTQTQTALTDPITSFVRPLAWTDGNSAVLVTNQQRDGTWKITLGERRLVKISEATYLGALAG